jgi:Zn-dependent protease with chaperone function
LMSGIAVGPRQFPEIHAVGEECARLLGIGVPQIFITNDNELNAYTYSTNDVDQIVVLTRELVEACQLPELKFIIGHECGHIHNQHTVYNTVWELVANPLASGVLAGVVKLAPGLNVLMPLLKMAANASLNYLFGRWHRSAEFTCDRAGLICCGDTKTAMSAYAKLQTGGANLLKGFNPDEYIKQMSKVSASPIRFSEMQSTHPIGPKRVEALRYFSDCETLFSWRPEMRSDAPARGRAEVDADCEKLMS